MKYNYAILGTGADFLRSAYSDIEKLENAVYRYKLLETDNRFINLLYRVHTSPTLNTKISLPFKGVWNSLVFKNPFKDNKPICFILFGNKRLFQKHFINYLRKKFPECKIVFFCQDLIAKSWKEKYYDIKDFFDLIISFDHEDVKKYNMIYHPLVYSCCDVEEDKDISKSDVFFVGKAKNRLSEILAAYEKLTDAGLKCDFNIVGVDEKERKYADKINYCSQMSYVENIKHIKATSCLLEIMQQGGHGYTLRVCEAIAYGKRMITNNPEIKDAPFYRPDLISVFDDPEKIDTEFVKNGEFSVDYNYKEELSPLKMLEFIEKKLN